MNHSLSYALSSKSEWPDRAALEERIDDLQRQIVRLEKEREDLAAVLDRIAAQASEAARDVT